MADWWLNDTPFLVGRSTVCGLKMESQSQINTSGNRYYYYRCYDTYRTGKCHFRGNINERYVETFLIDNVQDLISEYAMQVNKEQKKKPHKKIDISKYKEELERLNTMFLKGRIDEKSYDKEYERIQKVILEYETNTDTANSFDLARLRQLFNSNWENIYNELSREDKRQFWKETIKEIHFTEVERYTIFGGAFNKDCFNKAVVNPWIRKSDLSKR